MVTTEQKVVELSADNTVFMAICVVCVFIDNGNLTTLRAIGHLVAPAVIAISTYYLIGIPLSIFLAFHSPLGLTGYYLGLTFASVLQTSALFTYVLCLNWKRVVTEARLNSSHAGESLIDLSGLQPQPAAQPLTETTQLVQEKPREPRPAAAAAAATESESESEESHESRPISASWFLAYRLPILVMCVLVALVAVVFRVFQDLYLPPNA